MRSLKNDTSFTVHSPDVHTFYLFLLKASGVGRIPGGPLMECFCYGGPLVL